MRAKGDYSTTSNSMRKLFKMSKTKKKEKAKINNRENNDIDYNNSTTYKGIRRDIQY